MYYEFIGWCNEDNHDKVWVLIHLPGIGKVVSLWGRRGKKLQHKVYEGLRWFEIDRLINSKTKKGYQKIDQNELAKVYPEFEDDLQKTYIWALLSA